MSFSNYTAQAMLNSLLGKTSNFGALASVPTIHVGLSSTTPAEDGTGVTEPSVGSYARVATTSATWGAATLADPSVSTSILAVTFAVATANWASGSNMTHFVYYDALTAGNFLGASALTTPKPVLNGDTANFAIGDLTYSLD